MSIPPPPPPGPPPQWQQPPQKAPQPQWQAYPAGYPPSAPTAVERTGSPLAWLALGGAVVVVAGSFMTWATIEGFEISGIGGDDVGGTKDGALTLPLAGIAAVLILIGALVKNRVLHIIAAVLCGLAAAIAIYDITDINSQFAGFDVDVEVGIGLWMCAIGATVATVASIIAAVQTKKRPVA